MANVNTFTFEDVANTLAAIQNQVTGQTSVATTNTADWVSVAQTTLRTGVDPVMSAISRITDKTIFENRPYREKFKGLEMDSVRWGSHTRKLTPLDKPFEADQRYNLVDGVAIDDQVVNKPSVLQTNLYGESTWSKSMTIFKDQLDVAFSGPDSFAQFLGMVMQNADDQLSQARENLARYTLANFMLAMTYYEANSIDAGRVVHLVTEYNGFISASPALTWADICADGAEYDRFMKWACAQIMTEAELMTERTQKYHLNPIVGGTQTSILRHTPKSEQNFYILNQQKFEIETLVKSNTFHDNYLSKVNEAQVVNFWQGFDTPGDIMLDISCMKPSDGDYQTVSSQSASDVFAVIVDREAVGYTIRNQWSATAPFNARGGYTNIFWHNTVRWFNDNTMNGCIFLLD